MRISYSMPSVVLLIFAVVYFALWAWHPTKSEEGPPFSVLLPALSYLFPALLYFLAAVFFLADRQAGGEPARETRPALRDTLPLFTLAAVLYAPMLAMMGIGVLKDHQEERVRSGLSVPLGVCFILLFLSFAYKQTSSLEEWNFSGKAPRLEKLLQRTRRWFLRVAGWLPQGLLLSTGAILVLASLFLPTTLNHIGLAVLRGGETWITSISDVTGGIEAIQATRAFLGRAIYMLAQGVAATTVILVFRGEFRRQISRPSRLWTGLTALTGFLAFYSAVDLNFGWLGLYAQSRRDVHWALFCLWLTLWLLSLALWVGLSLRDHTASVALQMPGLHWLILPFLPVVLFDVVMVPVLVGTDLNLTGLASYVAGLQFLCWGFVRSISVNLTG